MNIHYNEACLCIIVIHVNTTQHNKKDMIYLLEWKQERMPEQPQEEESKQLWKTSF